MHKTDGRRARPTLTESFEQVLRYLYPHWRLLSHETRDELARMYVAGFSFLLNEKPPERRTADEKWRWQEITRFVVWYKEQYPETDRPKRST